MLRSDSGSTDASGEENGLSPASPLRITPHQSIDVDLEESFALEAARLVDASLLRSVLFVCSRGGGGISRRGLTSLACRARRDFARLR